MPPCLWLKLGPGQGLRVALVESASLTKLALGQQPRQYCLLGLPLGPHLHHEPHSLAFGRSFLDGSMNLGQGHPAHPNLHGLLQGPMPTDVSLFWFQESLN